jgi:alkanesulfonate monooxygenase SsuD/methylene tetrahydromethanopterin reductase-like flavin-dependent oxidoreductase (luciferase family)
VARHPQPWVSSNHTNRMIPAHTAASRAPASPHAAVRAWRVRPARPWKAQLVGVGISDRAAPGDDPVADAVTAEALNYDFVSAFDHPVADAATAEALGYGAVPAAGHPVRTYPTYETQTLLTWIAARTTRVGIMPRVLGVPFRRPALVAKAAESLQRLSRGRLILGLGAGYRDAEIRAAGGPDLTPRAKADGLQDAIAIIRGAWAAPIVRYHGSIYSVDDLDLEPKPAKPIPIWLGALGPRGLALTGRLADGWIPFLRFAGPDRIPELLDRIRTASVAAGRPADAVRAVYSVPVRLDPKARSTAGVIAGSAADITEQLHSFTRLGFTGFDLMPSRDQIRTIAEDVVPALRELQAPSQRPQPRQSPDRTLTAIHPAPRPRPAAAISPDGPAPEPTRAAS